MTSMIISIIALCLSLICLYLHIYLGIGQTNVLHRLDTNDKSHKEIDDTMDKCMDMVSRMSAQMVEMSKKMEAVDEVMEDFAEAGRMNKQNEMLISEGINNILNYAPLMYKKGDEDK